jgi:hypothetical protein
VPIAIAKLKDNGHQNPDAVVLYEVNELASRLAGTKEGKRYAFEAKGRPFTCIDGKGKLVCADPLPFQTLVDLVRLVESDPGGSDWPTYDGQLPTNWKRQEVHERLPSIVKLIGGGICQAADQQWTDAKRNSANTDFVSLMNTNKWFKENTEAEAYDGVVYIKQKTFSRFPIGIKEALGSDDIVGSILALTPTPRSDEELQANKITIRELWGAVPHLRGNVKKDVWDLGVSRDDNAYLLVLGNRMPAFWPGREYVSLKEWCRWVYSEVIQTTPPFFNELVENIIATLQTLPVQSERMLVRRKSSVAEEKEYCVADFRNLGRIYAIAYMVMFKIGSSCGLKVEKAFGHKRMKLY